MDGQRGANLGRADAGPQHAAHASAHAVNRAGAEHGQGWQVTGPHVDFDGWRVGGIAGIE